MIFQKLNRDDAEKVFVIGYNQEASNAWLTGAPVALNCSGTLDGVGMVRSNSGGAAKAMMTIGLADTTTAAGAYGLVQVYGMRTDAVINQAGTASNGNGAIGDILTLWTAQNALSGTGPGIVPTALGGYPGFVLMQTVASSASTATTTGKVFIRLL